MQKIFDDLGVPVKIQSDGGPQFISREFKVFFHKSGVQYVVSTPYYAQSNGHAVSGVKAMKNLIKKLLGME